MIIKCSIIVISVLITSILLMCGMLALTNDRKEKSHYVGESEAYEKVVALISDSKFTKSDLENYLRHDDEPEPMWLFVLAALALTIPIVAVFSGIKLLLNKLIPNHSFHSIAGSARSE